MTAMGMLSLGGLLLAVCKTARPGNLNFGAVIQNFKVLLSTERSRLHMYMLLSGYCNCHW